MGQGRCGSRLLGGPNSSLRGEGCLGAELWDDFTAALLVLTKDGQVGLCWWCGSEGGGRAQKSVGRMSWML
jgi:hypothetical protein